MDSSVCQAAVDQAGLCASRPINHNAPIGGPTYSGFPKAFPKSTMAPEARWLCTCSRNGRSMAKAPTIIRPNPSASVVETKGRCWEVESTREVGDCAISPESSERAPRRLSAIERMYRGRTTVPPFIMEEYYGTTAPLSSWRHLSGLEFKSRKPTDGALCSLGACLMRVSFRFSVLVPCCCRGWLRRPNDKLPTAR